MKAHGILTTCPNYLTKLFCRREYKINKYVPIDGVFVRYEYVPTRISSQTVVDVYNRY